MDKPINKAAEFAHGYRGHALETDELAGMHQLKAGQHEAIWHASEGGLIELSYVAADRKSFVVLIVTPENHTILKVARIDAAGIHRNVSVDEIELSEAALKSIAELRVGSHSVSS